VQTPTLSRGATDIVGTSLAESQPLGLFSGVFYACVAPAERDYTSILLAFRIFRCEVHVPHESNGGRKVETFWRDTTPVREQIAMPNPCGRFARILCN
jgi:hypothetical protein